MVGDAAVVGTLAATTSARATVAPREYLASVRTAGSYELPRCRMRLGEECGMASADEPGRGRPDLPEAAELNGITVPPPAHESVRDRVGHLRERAKRTRAGM